MKNTEGTGNASATAASEPTKGAQKGGRAPRRAHVALRQAKSGKKASSAKKAPKAPKRPKSGKAAAGPRPSSKTARILELLQRPGGVTAKELMKATGWLAHSVRGFLSGTITKRMGLALVSIKAGDGVRNYYIEG